MKMPWPPPAPAVPDTANEAAGWLRRAVAAREAQHMEEALHSVRRAAMFAPNDPNVALGLAQINFEAGLDAADLFANAAALSPERLDIQRSRAMALSAEGETTAAIALLEKLLRSNPGWIDGHRALCGLRTTAGDADFARSLGQAVAAHPQENALRMAWFHALAAARQWDAARAVLADAGETKAAQLGRLFLASESGEGAHDPALFDAVEHVEDVGLDLARVRHFLRGGQIERARDIVHRHRGRPTMRPFWSYLSLAWRLLGDPQADWLDREMQHVRTFDLEFTTEELAELAANLRSLHTMQAPWHEQSVRGGTQTDRPLLLRIDPVIAKARSRIETAVREYIAGLAPYDPGHPLLAQPRHDFRFSGSWSVRLRPGGFHSVHTHPMGWISSALYVAVPDAADLGPPPAGHLRFGTPPPELGLPLEPYGALEPVPGRLALFPSTMWHGTAPFTDGERLTIAFDIVPVLPASGRS